MAILNRYIKLPDDFFWPYIASIKIHGSTPYGLRPCRLGLLPKGLGQTLWPVADQSIKRTNRCLGALVLQQTFLVIIT